MVQEYHSFKVELATMILPDGKRVGVESAIFLQDIAYWCDYNKSSNVNFKDGRYWTYSTAEEICKRHPYWTEKQIRRIIKNCEEYGLLLSGNYNQNPYDRTKWYTVSDEVMGILSGKRNLQNRQIDLPIRANGDSETVNSIKYNNKDTETNTDNNNTNAPAQDPGLAQVMDAYMNHIDPLPTEKQLDMLKGYVDAMSADVCLRAIERAIDANARNWNYIRAILQNCQKDGIRSIADWERKEAERNGPKRSTGGDSDPVKAAIEKWKLPRGTFL